MLKSVIVTRHETIEHWNKWIVAVPDDMDDESIVEVMQEVVDDCDLDLDQEESVVDDQVSVDVSDAPLGATSPDMTLTYDGLADVASMLTAFSTYRLEAELERRRAKESDVSVV